MNYSKVITTGLGFLLGLVVYHFVKKALNGNGSVSVSEEETANAIGLKGLRRQRNWTERFKKTGRSKGWNRNETLLDSMSRRKL
jgi:hypothetical protein